MSLHAWMARDIKESSAKATSPRVSLSVDSANSFTERMPSRAASRTTAGISATVTVGMGRSAGSTVTNSTIPRSAGERVCDSNRCRTARRVRNGLVALTGD